MAVKKRLGEMLVDAGVIDETQLHAALGHQRRWGGRLGQVLIDMKLASEEAIVDALAVKFGFEVARFDGLEPYAFEQAKALVPRDYAVRNHVFPLAADTSLLVVAMSDPTNLALTDELAFRSGRRVKVCIAGPNAIAGAVRHHYGEDVVAAREAIALDVEDLGAVEPLYDPVGATSSEELNRFFQQAPAAPAPPAPAAPAAPAPRAPAKGASPAAPRGPRELQLEDQESGSFPLAETPAYEDPTEELQPIPLEPEPFEVEPSPSHAAAQAAQAAHVAEVPAPPAEAHHELTAEEALVLDALGKIADADDAAPAIIRPAQLLAALIRLMMRKQLITEHELLDEILRG